MKEFLRFIALIGLFAHHIITFKALADLFKDEKFKSALATNETFDKVFSKMSARFLTNWNFTNQTLYILIAIIIVVASKTLGENRLILKLRRFNAYNYYAIVLPFTVFIPALFWAYYIYDKELIFPKVLDDVFPKPLNHALHTNILILAVMECMYLDERPPKFDKVFKILTLYALTYAIVLCYTYFHNGIWLYNFLGTFNWTTRILAFLAIWGGLAAISGFGWTLHKNRYESRVGTNPKSKKVK